MFVNTRRENLFSESPHEEEEYRLLHQLNHIDQRLRSRRDSQTENEDSNAYPRHEGADGSHQKKWPFCKENQPQTIYNPHMEYFSQICNEEFEDDSLFDPQNNFLVPSKPISQVEEALYSQVACPRPQKKNLTQSREHQFPLKNSKSQASFPSQSQILKERNYIYKKETQNLCQAFDRLPLPPKNSKSFQQKSSAQLSKGEEKKAEFPIGKHEVVQGSFLKRNVSRQKYIVKPAIKQQRQSPMSEQREEEFKFHTFEAYMQNPAEINESSEKNARRSKCKHEDFDRQSLECTFKPTILKKSQRMAKSNKNVVERLSTSALTAKQDKKPYQRQTIKPVLNKNRIQQLSQPRRLKTHGPETVEERPSFRPSLSKKSLEQMSNCTYDVATRNQLWLQQRQEKIVRLRQEDEIQRKRREDCTYSPSLCPYRGDNNPQLSRFGREGMVNYFQRLSTQKNSKIKVNEGKENRNNLTNMNSSKENFGSKGGKKQKYQQAVKQLHNRIMGLKI